MNAGARAEHFFLAGPHGRRYCAYYPVPAGQAARGALLHVAAFGEEMNRSRRATALAARALAAQGWAVLHLDLHGCGDSDGDFAEARWNTWKADLALGHAWLAAHTGGAVGLWGVRLGALLALDYARDAAVTVSSPVSCFLLWQPVLRGTVYLNQMLRQRLASEMLAGSNASSQALRAALRREAQEIGGYLVAPELADAIEALDAGAMPTPRAPVHWLEVVAAPDRPVPAPAERQAWTWRAQGTPASVRAVHDEACWSAPEVAECPRLREATLATLAAPAAPDTEPAREAT